MNPLYQEALDGTLRSTASKYFGSIEYTNNFGIAFRSAWVGYDGNLHMSPSITKPGETIVWSPVYVGGAFVFVSAYSGAFMAAHVISEDTKSPLSLHCDMLCRPNDVGTYPQPNKNVPIPVDSPRVVVGCGFAPTSGNPVCREQYWHLAADSYVLAPAEERMVSYQETSGLQQTTSEQKTVAEALGVSVSAGWGPISASASASFSQSSTTMQQVVVTNETIRYESTTLRNTSLITQMFLKWQLTDTVTVFDKADPTVPLASIVSLIRPVLVGGPYNPDTLTIPTSIKLDERLPPEPKAIVKALTPS